MNVYDWDDTIYRGDSTFGFVIYLWIHRPKTLLNLPRTIWFGLLYALHIQPKLVFKSNLYRMFRYVEDMENVVDEYTTRHLDHVKDWYKDNQKEDDVVISASPEFLIQAFCKKVSIKTCMASRVDIHTGVYDGLNCHGEEKVRRYQEVFQNTPIENFYSDSYSDTPLAKLAKHAYIVKGDMLEDWAKK